MNEPLRAGVDVGGTFTDGALVLPNGRMITAKVPTTADQSEGVMQVIRKLCTEADCALTSIEDFSHAMTVSINALLEESGARTALITTHGFRDVLEIGRQTRPSLYDLNAEKPEPLVPRRWRYELRERSTTEGLQDKIDATDVQQLAAILQEEEIESAAICFLHAYAHPENEQQAADILREALDMPVTASHEVLAEFREYERTSTTVISAYLTPTLTRYLEKLTGRAADAGIPAPRIMQSNGGTASIDAVLERGISTIMSGPAAGVVGARAVAVHQTTPETNNPQPPEDKDSTDVNLVTLDMGGTSTDVSVIRNGAIEKTSETIINGRPIRTPMVDVMSIGAGGGSIAWVDDGGALRVGPRSAGSEPGPACYDRGGSQATVTDANLFLGYIGEDTRLGGELRLNPEAAECALSQLAATAGLDGPLEAAEGIHRIANARMTRAIRSVTVERGYDPRRFSLCAFGGAGPMHAAQLAEQLDISRVVIPHACGVLSAMGLVCADERHDAVQTHRLPIDDLAEESLAPVLADLKESVISEVSRPDHAEIAFGADLRYQGQSFELTLPLNPPVAANALREAFHERHRQTYGYAMDASIELVNLRATATVPTANPDFSYAATTETSSRTRTATFDGEKRATTIHDRDSLQVDLQLTGPAVVEHRESTTVIPPEWKGHVRADGALVLSR